MRIRSAPMPYLIGVRSDLMQKVNSAVSELGDPLDPPVYVYLDENRIVTTFPDLEQTPEFLVRDLRLYSTLL